MFPLLSIAQARDEVRRAITALEPDDLEITAALGRVLAEDVTAAHDVPPFPNSAMDGFAVRSGAAGRRLPITGEARAGRPAGRPLPDGEAFRISTGAVLPEGADAVIEVERVQERDGALVTEIDVDAARNVRTAGEDLAAGTVVLTAGTRLGPAELGVAVSAGRGTLLCGGIPRLAVVATGDELVDPGEPLQPGQIHNSNAVTLGALAQQTGARVFTVSGAADTLDETVEALGIALEEADVLVVSGGVSVGPHDHVKPALEALGVQQRFWGVALRPGKPTWFGTREGRLVFGLPGNPVSSMVTFLLFVRPALNAMQGAAFEAPRRTAVLAERIARFPQRDEAVRVSLATAPDGTLQARPTGPQGSHISSSMLGADALAILEAGDGGVEAGTTVSVEPI
ncbi:molybdopterin molybdotransferase MoeA [Capillimicrobium parvum]|uniref:Molybdopterin molybdenumtransferase n=1 Tax=Capillimicrobium parvum TaxID=2884022 RepID=A0A9E6XV38_9ACTN|nr:gephyrin-like molybdotransferase Glp [Capillimicrobium parvum]UGS34983.1 Molybdopterin molybdenumtransferase [Capillimicrobium parvum]